IHGLEAHATIQGLAQLGSRIQLQQRNCSRFARDFLRRSTFPSSQRTGSRSSGLRAPLQEFFRSYPAGIATNLRPSPLIEPSAAVLLPVRRTLEGSHGV